MSIEQPNNTILDGAVVTQLMLEVNDIFYVDDVKIPREAPQDTIMFVGNLLIPDSEVAYDMLAERWLKYQYTPMLRHYKGKVALVAQPGVVDPQPSNPWINLLVGILTVLSIQFTGALYECGCIPATLEEWNGGLPMMLAMMSILLAHEFGHYFAAKYHQVDVTLPYFIPLPAPISPVGTLGAFIQLRSPFKTKKQLFDIGVAGPIGGLIVALPLIAWGVASSPVDVLNRQEGSFLEGNSIFYLGLKYLIHGQLLPHFDQYADLPRYQEALYILSGVLPAGGGTDIHIDSFTLAAWFGLFVTAMNLLPVGQLDGGHLAYCLLGERARLLGGVLVGLMIIAGIVSWPGWIVWVLLVTFVIGLGHPPPLNELADMGMPRKLLAYAMIIVFVLIFMPAPLQLL
ncbi:site-2 protease family protein [Anaerolineales bacterium HSG6]|nr:site-2 protease family protein [Anaerolineales bacterium HSG6]MDM8532776.1 site-2 protease family protein [Anaerolineales bacterium HSG25]